MIAFAFHTAYFNSFFIFKQLLLKGFNVRSHYGTHRIERTREQASFLLKHLHGEWEAAGGGLQPQNDRR